jgi:hypothetical protein
MYTPLEGNLIKSQELGYSYPSDRGDGELQPREQNISTFLSAKIEAIAGFLTFLEDFQDS